MRLISRVIIPALLLSTACSVLNAPRDHLAGQRGCDGSVCRADPCRAQACDPLATCKVVNTRARCICPAAYLDLTGDGSRCELNRPCSGSNACAEHEVCTDVDNKAACLCEKGYERVGEHCDDVDECARGSNDCSDHAHCINLDGSFACTCEAGYRDVDGDGRTCQDIDECVAPVPICGAHAACENSAGAYACNCESGYEGNPRAGCTDTDECKRGLLECHPPATCQDAPGPDRCTCPGYYSDVHGDGSVCADDRIVLSLFANVTSMLLATSPAPQNPKSSTEERLAVAGVFQGELTQFCGKPLTSGDSDDFYLAELGPDHQCLWARAFGTAQADMLYDVAVDARGGVVLLAWLGDTLQLDGATLGIHGSASCALIRLDSGGKLDWSLPVPGCDGYMPQGPENHVPWLDALALDDAGNIYFQLLFLKASHLGPLVVSRPAGISVLLAKVSGSGDPDWAVVFAPEISGNNDSVAGWAFAVDGTGRVYLYAYSTGPIDFHLDGVRPSGAYLIALNPDGTTRWVRAEEDLQLQVLNVVTEAAGFDVLSQTVYSDKTELVVQGFDAGGTARLRSRVGDPTYTFLTGIARDSAGHTIVAGTVSEPGMIVNQPLAGTRQLFVETFDRTGNPGWVHLYGAADLWNVAVAPSGTSYVAAIYTPPLKLGAGVVGKTGNVFLIGLRP